MAVEKVSLSLDPVLAKKARRLARSTGRTLSGFVAEAVEYRLKLEESRKLVEKWESEQGAITKKELKSVRSKWQG